MSLPAAFLARPLAHRGLHDAGSGRVENTLSAVRAAVAAGYGIEIDVRLSGDGVAVVHHDATLERLSGRPDALRDLSADELARIRPGGGEDGIPRLAHVLEAVGGQVPVLVELKDEAGDGDIAAVVAATFEGHGGVAAMSFDPDPVARLARLAPRIPRGLTTCAFDSPDWELGEAERARRRRIADYDAVGACFVSHDHGDLDRPRIAALKARGAVILCWTVRSAAEETAARLVAHNITFEGYRPALAG